LAAIEPPHRLLNELARRRLRQLTGLAVVDPRGSGATRLVSGYALLRAELPILTRWLWPGSAN
jgi:hypothetical protein